MRVWDPLVGSKGALALNKLLDKVINIQYIRGLAGFHRSRTIKPTSFYTPYRIFFANWMLLWDYQEFSTLPTAHFFRETGHSVGTMRMCNACNTLCFSSGTYAGDDENVHTCTTTTTTVTGTLSARVQSLRLRLDIFSNGVRCVLTLMIPWEEYVCCRHSGTLHAASGYCFYHSWRPCPCLKDGICQHVSRFFFLSLICHNSWKRWELFRVGMQLQ